MIHVLIPAHNNRQAVLTILDCLSEQTYQDFKVVLIDDGSTDGTYDAVIKQFPDTIVLKGDGNLWWTGANVLGVNYILKEASSDDFVLLLNNDLEVEKDYIEQLVTVSLKNYRAIVGSTIIDANNPENIEAGVKLDAHLSITTKANKQEIEACEFNTDVDVLPGRGTLVPIEVFKKIGNFDVKRLPHYGADYEFMVRAKRAGYKLVVSHKAKVYADYSVSGLEPPAKKTISMRECFNLMFSKKSKINVRYYLNYAWLCSEKGYRLRNVVYSTLHILSVTLFKTIPAYPFYVLVFKPLLFIIRFLFRAYPLRAVDIERFGLDPSRLVEYGVVSRVYQHKDLNYYKLAIGKNLKLKLTQLSQEDSLKVSKLGRLSRSYAFKVRMLLDRLKLLFERG
ncbi:MAG: glycosyltransferase family 2 protein [Actinomycetota bacterium]|nr:glycosyltransferase family 2 protein [Actinomycetota bacterium]